MILTDDQNSMTKLNKKKMNKQHQMTRTSIGQYYDDYT